MSLQDTSWVQGSKVPPLLSRGAISFPLSQGPPAPSRQAPSSPKKQLKDFTCQLPSSIKESFASLGTAGPTLPLGPLWVQLSLGPQACGPSPPLGRAALQEGRKETHVSAEVSTLLRASLS